MERGEEFSPEGSAGSGGVVLPPPPKIALHNPEAIHREMARVYRDMRGGRIASQDGTRFVYVLSEIRKSYETVVMQRRLDHLEGLMDRRQDNG